MLFCLLFLSLLIDTCVWILRQTCEPDEILRRMLGNLYCRIMFFLTFNALLNHFLLHRRYTLCMRFYVFISHDIEWLLFYATIFHSKGMVKCISIDIHILGWMFPWIFRRISTLCILKRSVWSLLYCWM